MDGLRAFQQALSHDLLSAGDACLVGVSDQPGFAVYRNTVMRGCLDALAANYPIVQQIVGTEAFDAVATDFVRRHPPNSGVLADYGAGFDAFVASVGAWRELVYLAPVARLDRCWTESHLAADDTVLRAADLASVEPQALGAARVVLHPAARWSSDAALPAYSIWRRHRECLPLDDPLAWQGEAALLTRPDAAVQWTAVTPSAVAFLDACHAGAPFDAAMDRAAATASADDDASWFARLFHAGAFARLDPEHTT